MLATGRSRVVAIAVARCDDLRARPNAGGWWTSLIFAGVVPRGVPIHHEWLATCMWRDDSVRAPRSMRRWASVGVRYPQLSICRRIETSKMRTRPPEPQRAQAVRNLVREAISPFRQLRGKTGAAPHVVAGAMQVASASPLSFTAAIFYRRMGKAHHRPGHRVRIAFCTIDKAFFSRRARGGVRDRCCFRV